VSQGIILFVEIQETKQNKGEKKEHIEKNTALSLMGVNGGVFEEIFKLVRRLFVLFVPKNLEIL